RPPAHDRGVPAPAEGGRAAHPRGHARGSRVGGEAHPRCGPPEQGDHRARRRAELPRQGHTARALLRRRLPLGAGVRQPPEDGLPPRGLARRRHPRLDRARPAGRREDPVNPTRITTATVAARIPYANAAPFYALWGEAPFAVRNLVPRELGREA